jgi:glycosyltransferase involved in cell wall biosynthesis
MKLALSTLCENPQRRTGLSTLFHEFVSHALRVRPEVRWIVFVGAEQEWTIIDERVEVVRTFPSNERRFARLFADHFRVAAAAKRRGADALLTVGFVPLCDAGLPTIMHVFSVHHRGPMGMTGRYRRGMVKRGLGRAALVITNSEWTARHLGHSAPNVLVSYEGLQHERFNATVGRKVDGLPTEYLLWVANFYPYKRAELALAAYARLPMTIRSRFTFVLAGGDWEGGRGRAELAARYLGVSDQTRFLGWVSDAEIPSLYRGARAHVLSTAEETFGRSVVEAMACGCPCVLQDLPVLREVADSAAVFTDFANSSVASEALARICTDDALANRLRAAGLNRAKSFSFEKLARERIDSIAPRLKERS